MPNNLKLIIAGTVTITFAIFWWGKYIDFHSKKYLVDPKDWCELSNIKILSRAFHIPGGKGSIPAGIEFEDENRKTFQITGLFYERIDNALFDTLQYSSLVMSIFTDSNGCRNYFNRSSRKEIPVYSLKIGNRQFIALAALNEDLAEKAIAELIISPAIFAIVIMLLLFLKKAD